MKFLKVFPYAAFFVIAFSAGLWIFAPWGDGAGLVVNAAKLEAARNGYYVTVDGARLEGIFPPSYHFDEIDIEGPMVKATFSDFTVKLKPMASLFSRKASFHTEFNGAAVRYIPNGGFALERGKTGLAAGNGTIVVSDAEIEGDMTLAGDMVFDIEAKRLTSSTVTFTPPPEINMILSSSAMSRFVESVSPGRWRIRENAGEN
jgi:hypothetical protein